MNDSDPFDEKSLRWLFEKVDNDSNHLMRRESASLEFKENFSFASLSEYGKIGASFANRSGGYLIFGI